MVDKETRKDEGLELAGLADLLHEAVVADRHAVGHEFPKWGEVGECLVDVPHLLCSRPAALHELDLLKEGDFLADLA